MSTVSCALCTFTGKLFLFNRLAVLTGVACTALVQAWPVDERAFTTQPWVFLNEGEGCKQTIQESFMSLFRKQTLKKAIAAALHKLACRCGCKIS